MFTPHDLELIKKKAQAELYEERFREAVDAEKVKILTKKSVWERLFPFKITITRR